MRSTHRTATSKPSAQSAMAAGPRLPTAPACSGEAVWWDWEAEPCGMCMQELRELSYTQSRGRATACLSCRLLLSALKFADCKLLLPALSAPPSVPAKQPRLLCGVRCRRRWHCDLPVLRPSVHAQQGRQ